MIKRFLLITLNLFTLFLSAQNTYNSTNLVVSEADLENNSYPKDSTANALYLYEKGYSRIENGNNYNLLTDYEAKIKILNSQGFDKATIEIFLYNNKGRRETYRDLVAYTYNLENGKVVKTKLEKENVYEEKYDEHYSIIKFTFPDVKPGSVLTYKYQQESPFIFKFNGWDFQDDIPKIYSEYITDLPGNYLYNIKLVGPLKLHSKDESLIKQCLEVAYGGHSDCSHNVYVMKDIPAFIEEEYMTAKENYFSRIDFELREYKGFDGVNKKFSETWEDVDNKIKKEVSIGVQLKKVNLTKNVLPLEIQSLPNNIDKAKAIYRYIAKHYTWNKKNRIFTDGDIKKVISTKVGNVSSINILLHNALKQQGFDVLPVLMSTRDNGYVTKLYPVITDFNYLIVHLSLENNSYLLDATEKTLNFGEVPFRCLNQYGRLLDFKNGSSWINIEPRLRSSHYYKEDITLNDDLMISGKVTHAFQGYPAYYKRKKMYANTSQNLGETIKQQYPDRIITNAAIKNQENTEKSYLEEFHYNSPTEQIENIIYIKPFSEAFFSENPFTLNERTFPVDFGFKDSYTYLVSININEDHEFIDIPKNQGFALPNKLATVTVNYQNNGKKLLINHRINFNAPYYPIEYYPALKEIFNLIIDIERDTVISIKKIN